jgi:hypothetical protein
MHKSFIIAIAFVSFGSISPAAARPPTVEDLCTYAAARCVDNCGKFDGPCAQACIGEGYRDCFNKNAQIQIRGSGKNGSGNIKDFPGANSGLKSHANPNGGAMSVNPGTASTTMPAASGPKSTPVNPPSSSSISKPAAGGSGLLSAPGLPRLRAQ